MYFHMQRWSDSSMSKTVRLWTKTLNKESHFSLDEEWIYITKQRFIKYRWHIAIVTNVPEPTFRYRANEKLDSWIRAIVEGFLNNWDDNLSKGSSKVRDPNIHEKVSNRVYANWKYIDWKLHKIKWGIKYKREQGVVRT